MGSVTEWLDGHDVNNAVSAEAQEAARLFRDWLLKDEGQKLAAAAQRSGQAQARCGWRGTAQWLII